MPIQNRQKKFAMDQMKAPSILKQHGTDEKQKIKERITALRLTDRNKLEQATQEAKSEVLAFICKRDNIADCQTAELLGLDLNEESNKLENYAVIIMKCYDVVKKFQIRKFKNRLNQFHIFSIKF